MNVELETTVAVLKRELDEARREQAKLFEELQGRNRDLAETLEQQTATGAILSVIAGSPTSIQPVLDVVAKSAAQLCNAFDATIYLRDHDWLSVGAHCGPIPISMTGLPLLRDVVTGRAVLDGLPVHVHDLTIAGDEFETGRQMAQSLGFRTILAMPLLRQSEAIGALMIRRTEAKSFTDKQIQLLKTFANQAVIAIQNVRLFEEVEARTLDLEESLQQQTATADVLKAISRSTFDLDVVLNTLVESATRLCDTGPGQIWRRQGDVYRLVAAKTLFPDYEKLERELEIRPGRGTAVGRAVLTKHAVQIDDVLSDPEYERKEAARIGNLRCALAVPLLLDGEPIGALAFGRDRVEPFTQRQVQLVTTFADQAVIAIENARLFDEVQARTTELSEALQQQTATADVLKVISRSAFDLQSVLDALVETAARVCEADNCVIFRRKGEYFRFAAQFGFSKEFEEYGRSNPHQLGGGSVTGRVATERRTIHIRDVLEDPEYNAAGYQQLGNYRTALGVPLLREGSAIGVFALSRSHVKPFTDRQIELVQTFADQAVIAIENARLFEEVQARTADLSEALQHQTATADVLKVISRSAFDLQSVLQTLIDSAAQLCDAKTSGIFMRDGDFLRLAAGYSHTPDYDEYERAHPSPLSPKSWVGRTALDKAIVHIPDVSKDLEHGYPEAPRLGGYKSILCAPLMREGTAIGVLALSRPEVGPFSKRQIELVQTLADQAVIAIENVRLFQEVQARTADLEEALQQQTATADVLKVISRSAFDLQSVLDTLTESAIRLCRADKGMLERLIDGDFQYASTFGFPPGFRAYADAHPTERGRGSAVGRAAEELRIIHIEDILEDQEYTYGEIAAVGAMRTVLAVPLLRQTELIGAFALIRTEPRPFTAREIELVKTFADQAVIAIENIRLFDQVQARTQELARSLEDLQAAQDRLVQTEKLASLGQLTAGIAHEIKNPLNFVNNFSSLSTELIDELRDVLGRASLGDSERQEVDELTGILKGNLDKVVQHGKRADSIVKNMLLHSRAGSGEHRPTSVNAVVEESLNLAYHGARAERKDFNVTLERDFDPAAGEVDLYPQEITRVLLNLISNGFYATMKRAKEANGIYDPVLSASTRSLGESVEIRIRDNGTGIPPDVRESMFNPFFTTKPAGEGTGLGLSLSHDIVVKQHAGRIEVDTKFGEFTEFRIVLPRGAASLGKEVVP